MTRTTPVSTGLLALGAAALSGIIALELTDGLAIAPEVTAAAPGVPEMKTPEPMSFTPPPPRTFGVISERPLFVASRRPFEPPLDPAPAAGPEEETELTPLDADLVGVMLTERGRFALVQRPDEPGPERLHPGQTLDGWHFETLEPDRATFRRGQEVRVLELRAD